MGNIARFDLAALTDRYGISTFVETGTGLGDSLAYALPYFDDLLSCEIHADLVQVARERFDKELKIRILALNSADFLDYVCLIMPHNQPLLFWLDAHFPGADYGYAMFDDEFPQDIRLPLAAELEVIFRKRPYGRDVILIDDARIWLDGGFQYGNLPERLRPLCPLERDINFVNTLFASTHKIEVLYEHEGYIQLTPREISYA